MNAFARRQRRDRGRTGDDVRAYIGLQYHSLCNKQRRCWDPLWWPGNANTRGGHTVDTWEGWRVNEDLETNELFIVDNLIL